MAKRRRKAARRPVLRQVFASRSASMARENRAFRLWRESHNTGNLVWLENQGNYPKTMPERIAINLRDFACKRLHDIARLEISLDSESKRQARAQGISRTVAYNNVVKERRVDIERLFSEKAALDQIAWVLGHQKALRARGKKVDPLEPGPKVRELARELRNAKDKAAAFVSLVERVSKIPLVATHNVIAHAYYGLPTAEETLALNGILVGKLEGEPAWGCGMLCDVLNGVLTKAGWENFQARTVERVKSRPHSVALARVPKSGMWLVADPYSDGHWFLHGIEPFRGSHVVSQLGQYLGGEVEKLKNRGLWRQGRCSRELVKDFITYDGGH